MKRRSVLYCAQRLPYGIASVGFRDPLLCRVCSCVVLNYDNIGICRKYCFQIDCNTIGTIGILLFVNDIRVSDPGTAMTEGFLRLLIENGDVSYEICGSRVCLNIAILFKELACLFELESATMPKLRTIKGALKEIKATDPESVMTDYKIRWLIKSGRLRSYAVGTREIIVMESFDDENLLTQESREGCNITQGIKLSEQYGELLSKTTQSYTCTRRR